MFDSYMGFVVLLALCYGIIAISYQMVLSAGVLQAAHAALVGFGAYTGVVLTSKYDVPFSLALVAGVVLTGLVSLPVSLLALRLGHFFLVVATIGFGEVLVIIALNSDFLGAATGLGGMPLATGPWVVAGALVVTLWLALRNQNGRVGQALRAVGQDHIAASAVGIDHRFEQVRIFVLTGAMAGGAGVMLAHLVGYVAPSQMNFYATVTLFIFVVVGGLRSPIGAFLGAVALTIAPELLRFSEESRLLLYGVVVVLMTIFRPRGLVPRRRIKAPRVDAKKARGSADAVPSILEQLGQREESPPGPLLSVVELNRSFEGVKAVRNVSFDCESKAITGVIGPNGAGKTTLFNIISGLDTADAGRIVVNGDDITRTRAHERVALGIARTFQNIRLFPDMTALENVMVARHTRTRSQIRHAFFALPLDRQDRIASRRIAAELLDFVGLTERADTLATDLPYGDQRRLEVARALATEPRLLLLDEPSAGMNPTEQGAFTGLIRSIADLGISVMLIEHNIPLVMDLCDHVVVLNFGEVIEQGTAREARNSPKVIEAYFGTAVAVESRATGTRSSGGEPAACGTEAG